MGGFIATISTRVAFVFLDYATILKTPNKILLKTNTYRTLLGEEL